MGDYSLTIHIDQHWVPNFRNHNMRLCFAAIISSAGQQTCNVVALAATVAPRVTINWRENYCAAASRDPFSNGAKFTASTTIQSIQFGQTITLPSDWTDKRPFTDSNAPRDGFRFTNETEASCVLYKTINGNIVPIYISDDGPLPPGHQDLKPRTACRIWFAEGTESGTCTASDSQDNYMDIDLTGNTTAEVKFDATGTWVNV